MGSVAFVIGNGIEIMQLYGTWFNYKLFSTVLIVLIDCVLLLAANNIWAPIYSFKRETKS